MSVINTMLKDLDKRQQPHGLDELPVPPVQFQQQSPSRLPWLLLLLMCIALTAGSYYLWGKLSVLQQDNALLTQDNIRLSERQSATREDNTSSTEASSSTETTLPTVIALAPQEATSFVEDEPAPQGVSHKVLASPYQAEIAQAETSELESPKSEIPEPENDSNIRHTRISKKLPAHGETVVVSQQPQSSTLGNPLSQKRVTVKQESRVDSDSANRQSAGSMAVTEVRLSPRALANKRFAQGKMAQSEGELSQAITDFSEAITLDPSHHDARRHLAALYYGQANYGAAKSVLEQGWSLYPEEYDYALLLARVLEAADDTSGALAALAQIPDDHGLIKQKLILQSHLAQQSAAFLLAEKSYRQLARMEPSQAKWWMGLAYALDSQQQYSSAKQAYQQAISLQGLSEKAKVFIEDRLVQLGDIE